MTERAKRCVICKASRPVEQFNRRVRSKDGPQPHCRKCNRRASREYYRRTRGKHIDDVSRNKADYIGRNRELLLQHLVEHPCVDCGETDLRVLDFDHVRGSKRREVGRMAAAPFSVAVLEAEIAKCEVRCVNCHRRRTGRALNWWRADLPVQESSPSETGSE